MCFQTRNNPPFQQQLIDINDDHSPVSVKIASQTFSNEATASGSASGDSAAALFSSEHVAFVPLALRAMLLDTDLSVRNKALFAVSGTSVVLLSRLVCVVAQADSGE